MKKKPGSETSKQSKPRTSRSSNKLEIAASSAPSREALLAIDRNWIMPVLVREFLRQRSLKEAIEVKNNPTSGALVKGTVAVTGPTEK